MSSASDNVRVVAFRVGGEPERWRELGFEVRGEGTVALSDVRIDLREAAEAGVIDSWALDGAAVPESVDGLPTEAATRGSSEPGAHPNGAIGIDHVVVLTPSLERTTAAFAELGIECRRVRQAGADVRQGFFIVGNLLVEVVEGAGLSSEAPARFWGITVEVADIDRAADLLGGRLGRVKDAVQPGRRIATVRKGASGGLPLALITPRGSGRLS